MADFNPAQIFTDLWDRLRLGQAKAEHPFRTGAFATADALGRPDVRTVVLRKVDADAKALEFQTDRRSPKFAALQRNASAAWLFYDAAEQLQLRAAVDVVLHGHDAVGDDAWAKIPPPARDAYRQPLMSGAALDGPDTPPPDGTDGRDRFTVVRCRVASIEWLRRDDGAWRRLRFSWPDGQVRWQWLAP